MTLNCLVGLYCDLSPFYAEQIRNGHELLNVSPNSFISYLSG